LDRYDSQITASPPMDQEPAGKCSPTILTSSADDQGSSAKLNQVPSVTDKQHLAAAAEKIKFQITLEEPEDEEDEEEVDLESVRSTLHSQPIGPTRHQSNDISSTSGQTSKEAEADCESDVGRHSHGSSNRTVG
jgi:hypothetical protein